MKKHLKLILRTLISNNACVEAARTKEPKYTVVSIIFVLFALFFAALPTCVTGFQQNGGNWLRGITYSYDIGMRDFAKETKENGATFTIDEEDNQHVLNAHNWGSMPEYSWNGITFPDLHCFKSTNIDPNSNDEHKVLEIFYCENKDDLNLFVEEIIKNVNPLNIKGYTDNDDKKKREEDPANWLDKEKDPDKEGKPVKKNRSTSFIVFGKYTVQGALYQPSNTTASSSCYGDYNNTPIEKTDLIHNVLVKDGATNQEILEANQKFFDQVYVNPRRANTWRSTGIILGVDAGIILLMGFMVWVLTRGKNNPFRIYSFWDGQKIAYYACLTPGIISLFGFLMSNMAMMLFILGVGVRVMWLSMRTLRYQAPNKQ